LFLFALGTPNTPTQISFHFFPGLRQACCIFMGKATGKRLRGQERQHGRGIIEKGRVRTPCLRLLLVCVPDQSVSLAISFGTNSRSM